MRRRLAALLVSLALFAGGCHGQKQLTNKQLAAGAVGVGAVVGMLVLYSLAAECEHKNGGQCSDPDDPPQWPR
jgi:hypothetical protein